MNSFQGFPGQSPEASFSTGYTRRHPAAYSGDHAFDVGAGVFNHRIEGFVSLACADRYELPEMIAKMATDLPDEMWGQEQHASGQPANKIVYRTPDYLLSSVQDHLPGSDDQEPLWQVTLGRGATVFVNNPGCSFEEMGLAPGFWQGNAHLLWVAQWKNTLVAIYDLPQNHWKGFTYADFPGWHSTNIACATVAPLRAKETGTWRSQLHRGSNWLTAGPQALKELRAPGRQVAWICYLGRAALDGDFSAFQ